MNINQMLQTPKNDLINNLNQNFKENPEAIINQFSEDDVEEYDAICSECFGQTVEKSAGDEGWTYCESCQTVEGRTYEISLLTSLNIIYNWNTKTWSESPSNLGETL